MISSTATGKSVFIRIHRPPELPPEEVGKIDSHARAESVPTPHARVHIEHLEAAIARVALEFNFDQAGVTGCLEQPNRRLDDAGIVNGFDVGAELAEVHWVLAGSSSDHRSQGPPILA